ncbi:glycosyltransferase family 2 protein [Candidatus Pelagibacter sp.]|jgi:dolichol-phosphate mannosyltransferase|nr:glycosyltransferase family 2 protein [Candidatus Pelagibacter sp.]
MNNTYLSIIIPCYNEKKTIIQIINQIKNLKRIKKQIILVDDGSNDGTRQLIKTKLKNKIDKMIFHKINKGKGAAIISAIKYIKGNLVIIQDADLEYNPKDYVKLIKPFSNNKIKVVYGSRVLGRKKNINIFDLNNFSKNFRIFGNFILTKISNFINNQSLTDVHTCYKVFKKDVFLKLKIAEKDFSFCPEVTTKLAKFSYKITEVPIIYNGREIKDGKKIRFTDAIKAFNTIIKYKYLSRY